MSSSKNLSYCSCFNTLITRLKTEDLSYLYPCNWNIPCCFSQPTKVELDSIKKEIEAIKKFNGFNLNPLYKTDKDNTNCDNIVDEDIKKYIIDLKTDLHKLNIKLNNLEDTIQYNKSDTFCIVDNE